MFKIVLQPNNIPYTPVDNPYMFFTNLAIFHHVIVSL